MKDLSSSLANETITGWEKGHRGRKGESLDDGFESDFGTRATRTLLFCLDRTASESARGRRCGKREKSAAVGLTCHNVRILADIVIYLFDSDRVTTLWVMAHTASSITTRTGVETLIPDAPIPQRDGTAVT
jgi:hypothetical protein